MKLSGNLVDVARHDEESEVIRSQSPFAPNIDHRLESRSGHPPPE